MVQENRRLDRSWAWSAGSGLVTIVLAAAALFLPVLDSAPKGGLVGWLLFLAGCAELAFGSRRGGDVVGRTAIVSGLITAVAGLIFIFNPFARYFPVANVVMAWLLGRGAFVLIMSLRSGESGTRAWLALGGVVDLLLGVVLVVGLPVAALVVSLFGPTREIVANFSLILAISFAVTGLSQIAIGLARRRRPQ